MSTAPLILASSSRHRRALLARLGLEFTCHSPDIDETPQRGEAPDALAERLAVAKATRVAAEAPGALVIGSDQVAALGDLVLGKPGDAARARAQLEACAGREVVFHTAVCVHPPGGRTETHRDVTTVVFRALSAAEINRYVEREQPLDSAGAFRCEGLGISLFERIDTTDPTALIGLPLIWLSSALRRAGLAVP
ncbi:MAG: septum formation protein Maf [Gammaproteobacteria bacterium]|nr:MAG: septum formation protein Maf [Gammaproteobacteria bacterium]